jgi:hypothetical protein
MTSPATVDSSPLRRGRRFWPRDHKKPAGSRGWTFDKAGRAKCVDLSDLSSTTRLLTAGGDDRIVCGSDGANRYGCRPMPQQDLLAYGSSTASTISPTGYRAAERLRKRLKRAAQSEPAAVTYERELKRVRRDLVNLCGLAELRGVETVFAASGTDLHLFASQLMIDTAAPAPLIIRVEAAETGRGVPDALAGRHFADCAALGKVVPSRTPLDCGRAVDVLEINCRTAEGVPRGPALVDAEVEQAVTRAVAMGQRVLLTMVDVSKTGLIAPSSSSVSELRRRFPGWIEVLVDACQFRLAPHTLRAYLENDFLVAITGSKFLTGPTFCGATLVPPGAARRLRNRSLPGALKSYSARADWPRGWLARDALGGVANFGLLLRWEAALAELRAFRRLPEEDVVDFLVSFEKAITEHVRQLPALAMPPSPALDRGWAGSATSWDRFSTIFSFFLVRRDAEGSVSWLKPEETKKVHEMMREDCRPLVAEGSRRLLGLRCEVGQPVACGTRAGQPVSALRLCLSSRLIVDAVSTEGRGAEAVIAEALSVLDKAALLSGLARCA